MGREWLSFVVLAAESVNFGPQGILAELGKCQPQRWPRQGDPGTQEADPCAGDR
jgi:hypothetical protein